MYAIHCMGCKGNRGLHSSEGTPGVEHCCKSLVKLKRGDRCTVSLVGNTRVGGWASCGQPVIGSVFDIPPPQIAPTLHFFLRGVLKKIPKTIVNLPNNFWHAKILLRQMGIIFKQLFFQCRVLRYGPFDTLNTKVLEKIISGGLFMTPPQNTLQCTAMYCSVKA